MDSLEVSPSVPVGSDIVIRPFGTIGPDGRFSFDRFEAVSSQLLTALEIWGREDLVPGVHPEHSPLRQTQISYAPERFELKAIFLPSGEYAGKESALVEEASGAGILGSKPGSRISTRHIFESCLSNVYASRFPCRETAGQRA